MLETSAQEKDLNALGYEIYTTCNPKMSNRKHLEEDSSLTLCTSADDVLQVYNHTRWMMQPEIIVQQNTIIIKDLCFCQFTWMKRNIFVVVDQLHGLVLGSFTMLCSCTALSFLSKGI